MATRRSVSTIEGRTQGLESLWDKFYSPHTEWPKLGARFLKLPSRYDFDLASVRAHFESPDFQKLLKPLVLTPDGQKKMKSYRGVGLTSRKNAKDPAYDAFSLYDENGYFISSSTYLNEDENIRRRSSEVALKDRHFTERNEYFPEGVDQILRRFRSPSGKVRLLELLPGGRVAPHVDYPYYDQIRVHAAIQTNEDVWWEVDGEKFQIPADGSFYWFDTGKAHSAWNDGRSRRLILSIHLSVFFNADGSAVEHQTKDLLALLKNGLI